MKRWLIWTIFVASWTVVLQVPVPDPGPLPAGHLIVSNRLVVAKTIHVTMYAVLTLLSAWVPVPVRYRAGMMFFLMAHATATELLQKLLEDYCHRSGSLEDVGFNNLGILIGALVGWKWWTGRQAQG